MQTRNNITVYPFTIRYVDTPARKITLQAGLKISRDNKDNSGKILFLNENIYCDPLFEPSQRDGSNEGSQYMF